MVFIQRHIRVNERVTAPEVRVIGANSEQLGVVVIKRALELAKEQDLDLVEVAPTSKPPVCRIMDYSKYKYDQEKKDRKARKKQAVTHLKQIRLKPRIEDHDYQIKLKQAVAFLNKKDKVKINLYFRGREVAFKEQGKKILERAIVDLAEYGEAEKLPTLEGRIMSIVIAPKTVKTKATE